MREDRRVAALVATPDLFSILVAHAYRGVRVQFLLRFLLLTFMILVIIFVPPADDRGACYLVVGSYALWTLALAVWTSRGGVAPVTWMWVALLVDAIALGTLTLVAGASAEQSWTADLLVNGLFLIPMLAATQLRPIVCAAVAIPTILVYFVSSLATKAANTEPLSSILLRTFVIAGLGVGCVALSRVQLSRVFTIGGLARERADLLANLISVEARERTRLAEQLHDGALQYILAARQDLEDARESGDQRAFDRVDEALTQSATLLRSTVSDLHPAVLHAAGLVRALQDLAARESERTGTAIGVEVRGWEGADRTAEQPLLEELLFGTARELLANVAKHAQASSVRVVLERGVGEAEANVRLVVADNGRGIDEATASSRVAEGHVGLASLRARVAGAGGNVEFGPGDPSGTVATVTVPLVLMS
ncbi:sensor histidine kinase [Jatrophihabitans sp. DSM 45814]